MARRDKDAPSILQDENECFLSGTLEGLERLSFDNNKICPLMGAFLLFGDAL